jgi:CHAD domain-containing protein
VDAFLKEIKGSEATSIEAIHRGRVASRRLRELLPLVLLEPAFSRDLGRRLRKVTERLGAVRGQESCCS